MTERAESKDWHEQGGGAAVGPRAASGLPRRAANRTLLVLLTYVRAHPEAKQHVASVLARFARLDARLRRFARRNPVLDDTPALPFPELRTQAPVEARTKQDQPFELDARNAERMVLEQRMTYVLALERALDEQAARHREEVERLTREIDRLRRG
jgi:hypothetical protein